jgi:hypothetical protein
MVPCSPDQESQEADAACYSDLQVDTVRSGAYPMIVFRAYLSGTMGHYHRLPEVLVRIHFDEAKTGVLTGVYRGSGGDTELIAIANTIRRTGVDTLRAK